MNKIWKDFNEPSDTSLIWQRLNENGHIVAYFQYKNGEWVVINKKDLKNLEDTSTFDSLINGAPEELDTLGEIATALSSKEDKISGKGLSTNDFTDADKEQVEQAMPLAIQLLLNRTQDIDTIRTGAAAGASAYQKPSSGIPGSDLARLRLTGLPLAGEYTVENFQASYCTLEELAKAANGTYRTASYAGMSGTSSGFTMILPLAGSVNAVFGTFTYTVRIYNDTTVITISWQNTGNMVTVTTASIPDVSGKENTSNKVTSLSAQSTDTEYPSAKATYDAINPPVQSSQPSGGFLPNVVYDLGTLTESVTFALAAGMTGKVNAYHWTFDTGSTAPTITWPANIIWPDDVTPTVDANKHYEVLVRNGYASILVFSLSA